jgi:tetratricopeptide (TPR) repeat protein
MADKPSRNFIALPADQTLQAALAALKDRKGTDDWWLVVTGKAYRIATFAALHAHVKQVGPQVLDSPLGDLGKLLTPVEWVEAGESDEAAAKAAKHSMGLALEVWEDTVSGVVAVSGKAPEKASKQKPAEDNAPAQSINVQIAGDASGNITVAGDDVIYNQTTVVQEEEPKTPLGRALKWVEKNPVLAVIGFLVFTLVPTLTFYWGALAPILFPQKMTGEWNVAVATFTPVGSGSISQSDAEVISGVFYNRLTAEMTELGTAINVVVQVREPGATGTVSGSTTEERAASAAALAQKINADIIVYGTVQKNGDGYVLVPEFYVDARNFYDAAEMIGQHNFGGSIDLLGTGGGDLPTQLGLNRKLSDRSQALSLIARGLSLYYFHYYDEAYATFQKANTESLWPTDDGREVLYMLEGNAAGRANLLDESEAAYQKSLDIEPQYSRGYAGLASVTYLRAVQPAADGSFKPDEALLKQAEDDYAKALTATIRPETADIPTKVAIGLGQIYLVQWIVGQDTLAQATEQFQQVIDTYGDGKNPRIKEFAAEAHARLGLIARQQGDMATALSEWSTATSLSTSPSRRGLYYATLADIYATQGDADSAKTNNEKSITEYKSAIERSRQPETQADYWGSIATRYEKMGDKAQAISALKQALELLPDGSDQRQKIQDRIQSLGG